MLNPRISNLRIRGFRSFGRSIQEAEPSQAISVFQAGNSQGKTSFCEAIEFLLTGAISRRYLLAGSKDEFADSLRNAHLPEGDEVFVEAKFLDQSGNEKTVRRTLLRDYRRAAGADCESKLEIDGEASAEELLRSKVGITYFPPPLEAPILSQQTLGYLFSSSPADRAAYFRAALDTQDLEEFRLAVSGLGARMDVPANDTLAALDQLREEPEHSTYATSIEKCETIGEIEQVSTDHIHAFLSEAEDGNSGTGIVERFAQQLRGIRDRIFPVQLLRRKELTGTGFNKVRLSDSYKEFSEERLRCDEDVIKSLELFKAAAAIPELHDCSYPTDCPLCGTSGGLSQSRVDFIRSQVRKASAAEDARVDFETELKSLCVDLEKLGARVLSAVPEFCQLSPQMRRSQGFRVEPISRLVPDSNMISAWLRSLIELKRAQKALVRTIGKASNSAEAALKDLWVWDQWTDFDRELESLLHAEARMKTELENYGRSAQTLGAQLTASIDEHSHTKGWEDVIQLAEHPSETLRELMEIRKHRKLKSDSSNALVQIEQAIGSVQDSKFRDLSKSVKKWWESLRPDESTYFDTVRRRSSTAKRMISLRAGLAPDDERTDAEFRDAVAVFSQSQLHCLGLAMFLARAEKENAGFIVLDDPVLSSDEDYRSNFSSTVLNLLDEAGIQTIVTTQNYHIAKDIVTRWEHRDVGDFLIVKDDPIEGSRIRNNNDRLEAMLARVAPLCRSYDPEQRKSGAIKLREAIERLCKMILVKERRIAGDLLASITDYDGKNFSDYSHRVTSYLIKDASHPGKLKAAHNNVSAGPHDDEPPSSGALRHALGDVKKLKHDYLDT